MREYENTKGLATVLAKADDDDDVLELLLFPDGTGSIWSVTRQKTIHGPLTARSIRYEMRHRFGRRWTMAGDYWIRGS